MSRNFELLSRAGQGDGLFLPSPVERTPEDSPVRRIPQTPPQAVAIDTPEARWTGPEWSLQEREQLGKLLHRVFVFPNSHAPRVVAFCGVEGDGSGKICLGTGQLLAAKGSASVCLVDANFHAPSLHVLAGTANFPGLADAVVRPGTIRSFAARMGGGDLWVVPAGSRTGEAQGLFSSERLRARIGEIRSEFDYVLIDAPPVSSYGDAVLLGQMADGVILVLEADSTRREAARMAKQAFEGAKVKLLGAILNNRGFPIPEALYRKL